MADRKRSQTNRPMEESDLEKARQARIAVAEASALGVGENQEEIFEVGDVVRVSPGLLGLGAVEAVVDYEIVRITKLHYGLRAVNVADRRESLRSGERGGTGTDIAVPKAWVYQAGVGNADPSN